MPLLLRQYAAASVTSGVNVFPNLSLINLGGLCNLPTIPSASDFNTVLSSDQNTLDGTHSQHSQHSTSQDDLADIEEGNQCPAAVQLADAQVLLTYPATFKLQNSNSY